jgi:hypothetical protein
MKTTKSFTPKNQKDWRKWLEKKSGLPAGNLDGVFQADSDTLILLQPFYTPIIRR